MKGAAIGSHKEVRLILLWLRLVFFHFHFFFFFCVCVCVGVGVGVASNEDPAEENPTRKTSKQRKTIQRKGTIKMERGTPTESKNKKKEVWESNGLSS